MEFMSLLALMVAMTLNTAQVEKSNIIIPGPSRIEIQVKEFNEAMEQKERDIRDVQARERASRVAPKASPAYKSYNGAEVIGDSREDCVTYAKRVTGIQRTIGNGGRAGINSDSPTVGAIGVQSGVVHAVVVESIQGNQITVIEANWVKGHITRRTLDISEFKGFIV